MIREDVVADGAFCYWPNPQRTTSVVIIERSREEARAEWAALGGNEPQPSVPVQRRRRTVRREEHEAPRVRAKHLRFGRNRQFQSYTPERTWTFFPRTIVFYRGPSALDPTVPIIAVAGASTSNRKTGPMVQVWILRADMNPISAIRSGGDAAICGDCPHRGDGAGHQRSCYVEVFRAPSNIYQAITGTGRGVGRNFEEMPSADFAERARGKQLRIGAYGDPVAVPHDVWQPLLEVAAGWTAYTHQWRRTEAHAYQHFCMASVDTEAEALEAHARGWRTFRVRATPESPVSDDEITCPASEEAGHRVQCADCELCRGTNRQAKHIVIAAHGQYAVHFRTRAEAV